MDRERSRRALTAMCLSAVAVVSLCSIAMAVTDYAGRQNAVPMSGLIIVLFALYVPILGLPVLAVLLGLFYLWWFRPIARDQVHLSRAAWWGLGALAILSACWYAHDWELGLEWRGFKHLVGCATASALLLSACVALGWLGSRYRLRSISLGARWLVLAWGVTYGFAYFGELP